MQPIGCACGCTVYKGHRDGVVHMTMVCGHIPHTYAPLHIDLYVTTNAPSRQHVWGQVSKAASIMRANT